MSGTGIDLERRTLVRAAVAGALGTVVGGAAGQAAYPDRTVRVVVPFAPGGNVDIVARMMNQKLEAALGQTFVAENLPGASGAIGAQRVARAKPDGYTLLANSSIHVILPSVKSNLGYDVIDDFTPVSQITDVPMVMLIGVDHPARNHEEFVAWARRQSGTVDYSTFIGSAGHLAAVQWTEQTGVKVSAVQYKVGTTMHLDVSAARIPFTFDALLAASPSIRSGKLRPLAVTSRQRSTMLPDVPSFAEIGLPGVDATTWHGYWAPAGTPKAIVDRLAEVLVRGASDKDSRDRIDAMGGRIVASRPDEFARFVRVEKERFAGLMKRSGVVPE